MSALMYGELLLHMPPWLGLGCAVWCGAAGSQAATTACSNSPPACNGSNSSFLGPAAHLPRSGPHLNQTQWLHGLTGNIRTFYIKVQLKFSRSDY